MASAAELADLYRGRWRIEEAFKRLKHRMGLDSVSGLSQHALLVDVATKVLRAWWFRSTAAPVLLTLINERPHKRFLLCVKDPFWCFLDRACVSPLRGGSGGRPHIKKRL
jgi:IS4 transposase